jgi:6-pyruvoyltetrahydropterin/6-carboxytetrahydropterin synthase
MIFVTRTEHFSASHRLFNPEWTDEENARVFDKCSNPNGHGHNYVLDVTIAGEIDPSTGYVIDLKILKEIVLTSVIDKLDHRNLNTDVDFLRGTIPTAENLAVAIWNELSPRIPSGKLYRVALRETVNNIVEYLGPK